VTLLTVYRSSAARDMHFLAQFTMVSSDVNYYQVLNFLFDVHTNKYVYILQHYKLSILFRFMSKLNKQNILLNAGLH